MAVSPSISTLIETETTLPPADGEVYVWEMSSRQCLHRFTDDGCVVGKRVGVSPDNQFVACGSESGVVNVYERSECMKREKPRPIRAVMNLTTTVDHLQFNSTRCV